jgi:amino acid adenylation domain-containing protein
MPAILRLTGGLDVEALRRSFAEIARRHGTLRTTYAEVRGEHRQTVAPASAVPLPIVDLSALPGEPRGAEAGRLIAQEVGRPFDLGRGPVLRLCLLRHGGREHTLIANVHHIASDGWSMGVLVQESTALYEAFVQGLPSPLPELPIQYVDFAVWQRSWLTGPVLDAQLDFWRHELAGAPALLELPADRPRPAAQSYRGAFLPFPLTEGTAAVHALAERADATPFMVLLAAFQILLHRTAGADDVLVGSPVANRQRVAVEGLIGFFVNTLVYRLEVRPEEGFLTVLERVRAAALAAQEHQDLPFELLVEALGVERSLARNPLFQVMLAFQNAPAGELRAPDLAFVPLDLPISTSKFDLSLTLTESEAGLTGAFEYATDLFDRTTVARLAGRLSVLLAGAFAEPERRLSELPLLSAAERHQVLRESTAARREPDGGERETLDRLFARQAERTPHAIAVSAPEESLSYADLDRRSSRLAARLRSLDVGPEVPVVLLLPRSAALVVAILGVLKAGGCYVPLDPAYPAERLRMIALDCQPPVVVTVGELAGKLPPLGAVVLDVDEASRTEAPARRRPGRRTALAQLPLLPHLAGNAAYVIYTSGSTGTPKGVMIEHRQVTRLFWTAQETYGFSPDDVWTLFHSYAFDFSVWEIWGALLYGGRLVVVPYETSRSPEDFYQLLCEERVTVLNQTPSAFGQLIRAEEELGADPSLSLRWVIFGGEALTPRSLAGFAARHPQQPRLVNMYGITETTVHVTVYPLGAEDFQADRSPIGRALPDLEAWVLEPGGEPAPLGVPGELCVGGPGLARGYLERPELTAQRFVPHPFAATPGERLYRSGDLVRRLPGGGLEYFGRIDHQVKIRGFRIELGEIEAVLDRHPGVRESRVLVHGDGGDRRLVAWFVPEGQAPEEQALRALLRERLPEHMVPAFFVAVDAWPLTPNGKVDTKALPAPPRHGRAAVDQGPRTATERQVAALWSELLGTPNPGRDESFFELGGHSLLATLLLTRVREMLGVDLPLRALFEEPTIAGFAARIDALKAPQPPLPVPVKTELESETAEAPLSFSQERLWFLDRLEPGSPLYNIPALLRLTGKLDTAALQRSFREIVRRHGVLRTVFAETDGEPRQRVTPAAPVPLPLVDLSGLPSGKDESGAREAERLAMEEILRPFDLERGPMLRLLLLRHRRREHTLIANVHHIASDGWSLGILVREATALYQAFSQRLQTPLPELPLQYLDFALWQRRQLSGETLAAQLAFWRNELAGAPALLDLPTDRPRPAVQSSRGAIFAFDLPPQAAAAVHALARLAGATPFMVLLAAFQTLLHLWSGADDVLVGSPVANRNRVEDEALIGFFVNTLVFRLRFGEGGEGRASFRTVLERVRATALACHAHQDVPLELLMEALGVQRSLAHNPLFQVMLSLQNTPAGELKVPGLTFSPVDPPGTTAKFDLTLVFTERKERGGGFAGTIEYATDLFGAATVQRLADHFANLLTAAAADPDADLYELRLMDASEERRLRRDLNGLNDLKTTERPWALPIAVHDLFVQQARRTPENTAAIGPWGTMTYRELDERSSELAGLIRRIME